MKKVSFDDVSYIENFTFELRKQIFLLKLLTDYTFKDKNFEVSDVWLDVFFECSDALEKQSLDFQNFYISVFCDGVPK